MKKLKVLAICGSPRKGNTEKMLRIVLDSVKNHGKEVILLKDYFINQCKGCSSCVKTHKCIINDHAKQLNKKLSEADVIILGSPTYFDNISGLMKVFIDRTHPLYNLNALQGKKAAICVVGAADLKSVKHTANALERFCEIYKIKVIDKICIPENKVEKHKQKLIQLGEKINKLK